MLLKGNLHTHTTKSPCREWDPNYWDTKKIIEVYYKLQYDFLCISDHNKWWDGKEVFPYKSSSKDKQMTLIIGNELTDCPLSKTHVIELRYPSVDEPEEVLRILAHPQKPYGFSVDQINEKLLDPKLKLDAVEITRKGKLKDEYVHAYIEGEFKKPVVVTDDAHGPGDIADAYIVVDADNNDPLSILKAIKANKVFCAGFEYEKEFIRVLAPEASGTNNR
jgi:predicted metal-dependent phosphoesterase TrpH